MSDRIELKGAYGSPYTRKMLATLRYRQIPYAFYYDDMLPEGYPQPKVGLIPVFYFVENGERQAVVDSTPIIRKLESNYEGRSVIPADPAVAFINYLLEDFADEWLTKAMFHYRWYYDDDIEKGGKILPLWRNYGMSDDQHLKMASYIRERQISRLYVVGSNDTTAVVIEESYKRILTTLETHFQSSPFLLGAKPASADFAFYGQLTQLTGFDPTPMSISLDIAPRVHAWTNVVDDLSGLDAERNQFISLDSANETLKALLGEVGRVYAPFLIANASAVQAGLESFKTTIDGKPWQQPTFPYQAKCLEWLRNEYGTLSGESKSQVDKLLQNTGCEELFNS